MRAIPFDTSDAVLMCATLPKPRIKNFQTGEVDVDRESGQPMFSVGLVLTWEGRADVIPVMVPESGVPADLQVGATVQVAGLVYRHGEKSGRKWEMFTARSLIVVPAG